MTLHTINQQYQPDNAKTGFTWQRHSQQNVRTILRGMILCVLLPTLIGALYFGFIAAPQYQTEMHISVRSAQTSSSPSLLGNLMSGMGAPTQSTQDIRSVAEYIQSYEAVQKLIETIDLRRILSHPDADFLTRMPSDASLETVYQYYKRHVDVVFNTDSGAAFIYVRAFTPEDAVKLASAILTLSENSVNSYNQRAEHDGLQLARAELARAEEYVAETGRKLTAFRVEHDDIDPASRSGAIMGGISALEQEYNTAQVQLRQLSSTATKDNVQLRALRRKVGALENQIAQEQKRLTGDGNTYSQKLAEYQNLMMVQELAQQAYASALVSLENAQIEAQRQKSYVVPIVNPHTPEDAEYPKRLRGIFLVFVSSLLIFGIGRLVIAGVRDHMMH